MRPGWRGTAEDDLCSTKSSDSVGESSWHTGGPKRGTNERDRRNTTTVCSTRDEGRVCVEVRQKSELEIGEGKSRRLTGRANARGLGHVVTTAAEEKVGDVNEEM